MAGELVLITGATGHPGFRVLRYVLEQRYNVRATIRSEAKSNPALVELNTNTNLSFAVVPDITAPDAYLEAIKDVSYVIHIASPLPNAAESGDFEATLIQPAVQGTLSMLEAAQKSGTVKRIVITSSCLSIIDWEALIGGPFDRTLNPEDRIVTPTGPYALNMHAYWASKVTALNKSEESIKAQTLRFDNDVKVAEKFPEAVRKGILPNDGNSPTFVLRCDGRKAEEMFGFRLRSLEEQVVEVVGQYLEIVGGG
ncbi:hypothetical protein DOTSEDRAFT_32655 [Dothistroma septosporum NZE10]|uniref:NAD-dependent epimerase/dehydratase domain-containing protein n=1 Tax=Dothistroma septosporum (strain NZE10 / CBS 128990) TaxID=675120 RepID=N1PR80_DOTSN|nr:hypothetical protein DOTSEDRAFT_32655 [Dothistroma septosporum NZE10]